MLDIIDTVALLICEVKPYISSLGNLLVILYILFVNLRASFQTGKSSNDLIVAKCEFLSGINRPIFQSANLPIKNKYKYSLPVNSVCWSKKILRIDTKCKVVQLAGFLLMFRM